MSSCVYLAPNGAPSKNFDELYKSNGLPTAVTNFQWFTSPDFQAWYGKGERTTDGEPVIQDRFVTNELGEIQSLRNELPEVDAAEASALADNLKNIFSQHGITVDVAPDPYAAEEGYVINTPSGIKLRYNPAKATAESIFHEYGHLYVDLIGYQHPLVQKGIEQLKDSELWNTVAKLYPELDEEQLGKEVLTTAIGIEANQRYNLLNKFTEAKQESFLDKIKNWKFWVNQFFRLVGEYLGINNDVAAKLAYDLTGGRLRNRLTGTVSFYKQAKKTQLEEILDLVKSDIELTPDKSKYQLVSDPSVKMERVTTAIHKLLDQFDRDKAIQHAVRSSKPLYYKYNTVEQIEKLWADKREEGTAIHGIAENYINSINSGLTRSEAKSYVLANLHKPENAGEADEDGIRYYSGMHAEQAAKFVDTIFDIVDDLKKRGYKLYPEVKIGDDELGVAGTIDLLAVHPDGYVEIFDFKTKEMVVRNGKVYTTFDEFDTVNPLSPSFNGFMRDVSNSKRNEYGLQLSAYKLMLQRLGIDVRKLHIVPLIGEIEEIDGEYHYTSLHLYKSSAMNGLGGKTFEVPDLSARLEAGWLSKDDIETIVRSVAISSIEEDEFARRLKELAGIKDWIKETIFDLQRSIRAVQAQADKDTATNYKDKVEQLIARLMTQNEYAAIAAYTEFVETEINNIRKKLFSRIATYKNKTQKLLSGYSTLSWKEIKQLEENDPQAYAEFVAFLINTQQFVDQVVHIKELPFTSDEKTGVVSNLLLKRLKDFESSVSDIQHYLNRLNNELNIRYFELSSNPLFTNGDTVQALKLFMGAQKDETWAQANLDALADTHHPFIANVVKMYDIRNFERREEEKSLIEEWIDKSEGRDLNKFMNETKTKLVTEIDWKRYFEDVDALYVEANKHGKNSKKYKTLVKRWFNKNTVRKSPDEIKRMLQAKLKELGKEEFRKWNDKQHYYSTSTGKFHESRRGAYYKPNPAVYETKEFTNLTAEEKEFLNYLRNLFYYLVEHVKDTIIEDGYIPAIPLDQRSVLEQLKDKYTFSKRKSNEKNALLNRDGSLIYVLPFEFNSLLNQEPYERIYEDDSADVKEEKRKRNKEIAESNERAHSYAIQKDLSKVVPAFIKSALLHKYKKGMEFELLRVQRSMLNDHKIIAAKNGISYIDKYKSKVTGIKTPGIKTAADSKIYAHYNDWLRMVFYDQFELDEKQWTKIANTIQNYTSFKGLALNPFSAVNNVVYGKMMSRIESAAGDYYSPSDWLKSKLWYDTNIHNFFADRDTATGFLSSGAQDTLRYSSKASAFTDEFHVLMDVKEDNTTSSSDTSVSSAVLKGMAWAANKAYALQHIGEHMMQNRLLFSMANSHKIVDGKIMSFKDYTRGKLEKADAFRGEKEANKAIVERNREKLAELKKTWANYSTLYDAYDFVEGRLKLKEEFASLDKTELAKFERRVLGVNQYLHGIYNKEDAGAIQSYALGRLAVQFRKWMRPGWTKRWGTRFNDDYWNERRSSVEHGIYVTTMKFIAKPFTKYAEDKAAAEENEEQFNTLKALANIIKDYASFFTNAKVHWHSMEEHERSAVIKTALEWGAMTMFVALLYMLKELKGDDKDPNEELLLAMYQMDRSILEMTTYVPIGFAPPIPGVSKSFIGGGFFNEGKKLLKSPTATYNSIEQLFKVGKYMLMYPFASDEDMTFKTGVYHGQNKLAVEFQKMLPLYNQFFRYKNLNNNYKYYQLF